MALRDHLLADTEIEALGDEVTDFRSHRKFHLFVFLCYLPWTLPGHTDVLFFGLFREESINGTALSPGRST